MEYYVAKCHVRLVGYTARPGEVIEEALDEKCVQRLLRLGAIEPFNIPKVTVQADVPAEQGVSDGEEPKQEEADQEEAESDGGETTETENGPAPEIDIMDGISSAPAVAPAEKQAKKSSRGGGKTK